MDTIKLNALGGIILNAAIKVHRESGTGLLESAFEINFVYENEIIIEIKAAESIIPIFEAQLISYLKLSGKKLGYLINFNVLLLKLGFKPLVYKI